MSDCYLQLDRIHTKNLEKWVDINEGTIYNESYIVVRKGTGNVQNTLKNII